MLRHFSIALASAVVAASMAPASAGSLYRDQVHADSFDNLVVYSPSGYKRIVVGAGELAAELRDYGDSGSRRYRLREGDDLEGSGGVSGLGYREDPDCSREPVVLHGRSYMYGLPRNVVAVPSCD